MGRFRCCGQLSEVAQHYSAIGGYQGPTDSPGVEKILHKDIEGELGELKTSYIALLDVRGNALVKRLDARDCGSMMDWDTFWLWM